MKKPTSCMELNDKKLNHCCLRSEKKKMSGHITSVQHYIGASSQCSKTWKISQIAGEHPDWKTSKAFFILR